MSLSELKNKGGIYAALFFLLFVTLSCNNTYRQWQAEHARTSCPVYASARLYLPVERQAGGIELELLQGSSGTHLYANVFSLPLPYGPSEFSTVKVNFAIEDCKFSAFCDVLQGGQRLLFPDDAASTIITALYSGQIVYLSVGRYAEVIVPLGFDKLYREYIGAK